MGDAFLHEPFWQYLVPNESRRAQAVALSMGILMRYSLLYGKIYTNSTLDGIACWLPPGETAPSFSRLVRIGVRSAPLQLGLDGFRRYMTIVSYSAKIHKDIAPGRHWYLWGLGVKPLHDLGSWKIAVINISRKNSKTFKAAFQTNGGHKALC
jgi:hypothetical protein